MAIDKRFWSETSKLMDFARENGRDVVARIYEYRGQRYPVWEKSGNPSNVWLISKDQLDETIPNPLPPKNGSYPHLRAEGNGYYIYGFRWNQTMDGQARGEFFRYLTGHVCRPDDWNVLDSDGNPIQPGSPSSTQNKPAPIQTGVTPSPRKSAAPVKSAAKNKKKEADPDLDTCKAIIADNFRNLQTEYQNQHEGRDFIASPDVEMFFRKADLDTIREWNEKASDTDDLIDLCAFYELTLGNPSKADVVILGNNPGAKGVFERITSFEQIFKEMEERKNTQDLFYPMSSVNAMKVRPWFPNRLIYGVGSDKWKKRDKKDGILYPFMQNEDLSSLCQYADRIATVELVPYHTKTFAAGERFLDEFDLFDPTPVIQAMKNNAVIIALYRNAATRWCDKWKEYRKMHPEVKDLERYSHFYVNHKKENKDQAGANASLSRQTLRRYSEFQASIKKIEELYPDYDAYSEITDYLAKEKGWTRIK